MPQAAYEILGVGYRTRRHPDPRIAAAILGKLAASRSILNIGAGAGSYEPTDRPVIAVEPAPTMVAQRPANAARCVRALAEALPFATAAFDAATAFLTIHHWTNLEAGLKEARRVARHRLVILTWDPHLPEDFWLTRDYLPEITALDRARYPSLDTLRRHLGPLDCSPIPIPADCADGFRSAYWKRPEAYLDPAVRRSISAFAALDPQLVESFVTRLAADLASGAWASRNADLAARDTLDLGYRIVTSSW